MSALLNALNDGTYQREQDRLARARNAPKPLPQAPAGAERIKYDAGIIRGAMTLRTAGHTAGVCRAKIGGPLHIYDVNYARGIDKYGNPCMSVPIFRILRHAQNGNVCANLNASFEVDYAVVIHHHEIAAMLYNENNPDKEPICAEDFE